MKVFLGGSKTLGALPRTVIERLTECIAERCIFLVGDCHGADLAFQKFLYDRKVEDVFVYCSGSAPRFNAGGGRSSPYATIRIPDINFMQSRI